MGDTKLTVCVFFFFNDTATTEIYTLSLHDALPISTRSPLRLCCARAGTLRASPCRDRKSTRLNSSHITISYAVFCLKKKKTPHLSSLHQEKKRPYPNLGRPNDTH